MSYTVILLHTVLSGVSVWGLNLRRGESLLKRVRMSYVMREPIQSETMDTCPLKSFVEEMNSS